MKAVAAPTPAIQPFTASATNSGPWSERTCAGSALCRDEDVRFEFTDGILRVEVGKERGDVTGLVIDLIEKLDPEGVRWPS
jgi:hypothetical protein